MTIVSNTKIQNTKYSSKNNFILTGNNISYKQNTAIRSLLKRRVLETCHEKSNNISENNKNDINESENSITHTEEPINTTKNVVENENVPVINNNLFDTKLPEHTIILDNIIIHILYIYKPNTISIFNNFIYFNGSYTEERDIIDALTMSRYRINDIPYDTPIGFLSYEFENINDLIEINYGIVHDKIVVNGDKVVTLYESSIIFTIKFINFWCTNC